MVTKNYRNASRIIRPAITESYEHMMTDFISLLCIFVCRRLFLEYFARDTRTSMAVPVISQCRNAEISSNWINKLGGWVFFNEYLFLLSHALVLFTIAFDTVYYEMKLTITVRANEVRVSLAKCPRKSLLHTNIQSNDIKSVIMSSKDSVIAALIILEALR